MDRYSNDYDKREPSAFLTKKSLVKESPFTPFFANALVEDQDIDLGNDQSEGEPNEFYSPSSFNCLKQVIHLFPLWSRAVYQIALGNTTTEESLPSMTNAKVESYFRTLKKGTLAGKMKLRPRELLCEQLKRIRGALKARTLPQPFHVGFKRSRETVFLKDAEEQWRDKKKRKKYSDIGFCKRVLNGQKRKTDTFQEPNEGRSTDVVEDLTKGL